MNTIKIRVLDEELILLPEKAIYYEKENALIIADIHLGKTGHFRKAGIPLPSELAYEDLSLLSALLESEDKVINKLIVLGDLFHSEMNVDWTIFDRWRESHSSLSIYLIKGNHDILTDDNYRSLNLKFTDIMILNCFTLVHDRRDAVLNEGKYIISGHIHPGVRMKGKARQAFTLPCFHFGESSAVLPAFGEFTGKHLIKPAENDLIFVITDQDGERKVRRV